jgi:type I restriction enzyme M protein
MKDATVKARIKVIRQNADSAEELQALQEYLLLSEIEWKAKRLIKESTDLLDMAAREKYEQLTNAEIKQLLVEGRWFRTIYNGIDAIHSAVPHRLSSRVTELVERYEFTLPECEAEVSKLESKVKSHLERMGFAW